MPPTRRDLLIGTGAAGLSLALGRSASARPAKPGGIKKLYQRAMVIDALGVLTGSMELPSEAELKMIRESGVDAVHSTVGVEDWDAMLEQLAWCQRAAAAFPRDLSLVRTHADLVAAKRARRVGIIMGLQGTLLIGRDLSRIDLLHGMGVRVVQLTYNLADLVGDGCLSARNAGLTQFGRDVVARLDKLRMAVDLSHCGAQTTLEGIQATVRQPLITHSGCDAVFPNPRNKTDQIIKAMADRGGVLGIYLMPFLGGMDGKAATADMVLDHIDHALKVAGADHVGIGTDQAIQAVEDTPEEQASHDTFVAARKAAGIAAPGEDRPLYVPELNGPRKFEELAMRMAKRGHKERVIENVLGANWARVFKEIWGS